MTLFRSLFFAAVLSGLIAGLMVTAIHAVSTVPIILQAETYEAAGANAPPPAHDHGAGNAAAAHEHGTEAWAPGEGIERTAYTALADVLTGIGCALLLCAAYALRGQATDWCQGMFWGLAGFAAFTLAPGLGLPPELPGTEAAPLLERQVWWLATVAATAGGLALIFLGRRVVPAVAGAALIVLPHVIGAPQPEVHASLAPASLGHDFVVAATMSSFAFWLVLGMLSGLFYGRFAGAASINRTRPPVPA